jgi:hypothetical protein
LQTVIGRPQESNLLRLGVNKNMDPKKLLEAIQKLSGVRRIEAEDFIRYLATREELAPIPKMQFRWAGGLADLKSQYTSRDLKKQALDSMS